MLLILATSVSLFKRKKHTKSIKAAQLKNSRLLVHGLNRDCLAKFSSATSHFYSNVCLKSSLKVLSY